MKNQIKKLSLLLMLASGYQNMQPMDHGDRTSNNNNMNIDGDTASLTKSPKPSIFQRLFDPKISLKTGYEKPSAALKQSFNDLQSLRDDTIPSSFKLTDGNDSTTMEPDNEEPKATLKEQASQLWNDLITFFKRNPQAEPDDDFNDQIDNIGETAENANYTTWKSDLREFFQKRAKKAGPNSIAQKIADFIDKKLFEKSGLKLDKETTENSKSAQTEHDNIIHSANEEHQQATDKANTDYMQKRWGTNASPTDLSNKTDDDLDQYGFEGQFEKAKRDANNKRNNVLNDTDKNIFDKASAHLNHYNDIREAKANYDQQLKSATDTLDNVKVKADTDRENEKNRAQKTLDDANKVAAKDRKKQLDNQDKIQNAYKTYRKKAQNLEADANKRLLELGKDMEKELRNKTPQQQRQINSKYDTEEVTIRNSIEKQLNTAWDNYQAINPDANDKEKFTSNIEGSDRTELSNWSDISQQSMDQYDTLANANNNNNNQKRNTNLFGDEE